MRYSPDFLRFFNVLAGDAGRWTVVVGSVVGVIAVLAMLLVQEPDLRAAACGGGGVTVIAESSYDRDAACTGAGRAIAVLGGLGLTVLGPIVVQVVDEITIMHGVPALGLYDPRTHLVKVLARSAFSPGTAAEAVLGLPFDEDLHASVFAHEVTHAVLHQYEEWIPLGPAAHEYVAYSVQLATLPGPQRRRILDRFEGAAFSNVEQISEIILAFDPNRFAVKAYLHFRDAADQHAVLEGLIGASRVGPPEWY